MESLLRNADVGKITRSEAEAEIERLSKINTDWFDVIFKTAFSQNHSIALSGGTEKSQYYATLNYRKTNGIVPTNVYENWGGSLRLSQKFNSCVMQLTLILTSGLMMRREIWSMTVPIHRS